MKVIYINLFSLYIMFQTHDEETYNLILQLFSNIITQKDTFSKIPTCTTISILKNGQKYYIVKFMNNIYKVDQHTLIEKLVDFISESFSFFQNKQFAYFHSSVVAKDGKCTLIIAPSHHGKTTLSTRLTLIGYQYISDDIAIVDKNGNLWPFPTPIKVSKNPTVDMNEFKDKYSLIELPSYWILTPRKTSNLNKKYYPNKIIFLNRDPQSDFFNCIKLSRMETINKLINNASYIENPFLHSKASILLSNSCSVFNVYYKDYQQIIHAKQINL